MINQCNPLPEITIELERKIRRVVWNRKPDMCWPCDSEYIKHKRGRLTTKRIAYKFFTGVDPEENLITQACGNKRCCNPKHLVLITKHDHSVKQGKNLRGRLNGGKYGK